MTQSIESLVFKDGVEIDLTKVSIISDRIKLVAITHAFTNDIFREFTSEIATYLIPSPSDNIGYTQDFISESITNMTLKKELVVAITSLENEFLGCTGLHGRGQYKTPEFGIWLKKSAHGNKYGQEAIRSLLYWARTNIEFDYAIYPVDKANIASRKIPESLGGVIWKEAIVKTDSGNTLDEVIYKVPA